MESMARLYALTHKRWRARNFSSASTECSVDEEEDEEEEDEEEEDEEDEEECGGGDGGSPTTPAPL
jgi:hypothetical protein